MALKKLPGGVIVETTAGARLNEEAGVNLEAIHRQIVAGAPTTEAAKAAADRAESAASRVAAEMVGVLRVSGGIPGTPSTTRPSVNLYDYTTDTLDAIVDATSGIRETNVATGWRASARIAVDAGQAYTISHARHVRVMDSTGAVVAADGQVLSPAQQVTFTPSVSGFVRFSYAMTTDPGTVMMVAGTTLPAAYEPYGVTITVPGTPPSGGVLDLTGIEVTGFEAGLSEEEVAALARAEAEAATTGVLRVSGGTPGTPDVTRPSVNLYDYTRDKADTYVFQGAGADVYAPLAGFRASAPIPVTVGRTYTITDARHWVVRDNADAVVVENRGALTAQGKVTFTAVKDGNLYFSYRPADTGASPSGSVMVVEGETIPSTYEPYGVTITTPGTPPSGGVLDLSGIDVRGLPAPTVEMGKVEAGLSSDGATLTITTALADGKTLRMVEAVRGRDNRVLNHMNVTVDGATVHPLSDDIAPIRTQHGTIGANHGFAMLHTWPAAAHSLTRADLGSVWSDGTRTYILLGINAAGVAFLGAETTNAASGEDLAQTATPAGDLTRQGETAGTLTLSSRAAIGANQMYPAVQRVRQVLLVDGSTLAPGETRTGNQVQVRESYEVLDYTDMLAVAKANPGKSYAGLPVRGAVRFESVHTWRAGGTCAVDVALTEMRPTKLNACGLVQSIALAGNTTAGKVTRYVPGVTGWTDGVDLASHSTTKLVGTADLTRPGVPPVMTLDVRSDVAFALGVHPWRPGVTTAAARLAEAPTNLWDLRSTDKSYPTVIVSEAPGWGRYEGHAYRVYMTKAQADQIVAVADDAYAAHSAIEYGTTLA